MMASLRALLFFTLVTGVLYPLAMTLFASLAFSKQASGSLISRNGILVGSRLLSQKMEKPEYFFARPSAADYGTLASGASNYSPTSAAHKSDVEKRGKGPADLLTTSGSGLDPHVSVEAALSQIARVAKARNLSTSETDELRELVERRVEGRTFGFLGNSRVNVLELNLSVDDRFPPR